MTDGMPRALARWFKAAAEGNRRLSGIGATRWGIKHVVTMIERGPTRAAHAPMALWPRVAARHARSICLTAAPAIRALASSRS